MKTTFSPREEAVAQQVALGNATKEIAHNLGRSEATVKVQLRAIMKKMGCTNRTQVATRLITMGGYASKQGEIMQELQDAQAAIITMQDRIFRLTDALAETEAARNAAEGKVAILTALVTSAMKGPQKDK